MLQRIRSINKLNGYISLIGGCFIQFTIGCLFTFGNLVPYFASYLAYDEFKEYDHPLTLNEKEDIFSNQTARVNWIYFVVFMTFGVGVNFGGRLETKHGPKVALMVASLFMSIGFGCTFFALKYGGNFALPLCIITFGIILGAGVGAGYPVLIVVGMRWFPAKQGFIGGFCLAMIVCGAVVFDSLQSVIINPQNINFNPNLGFVEQPAILARIPLMCLYIALIMALMQSISILCISNPPWFSTNQTRNATASKRLTEKLQILKTQFEYERYSLTALQSMNFSSFWILFIQTFFYVIVSTVAILQWKVFAVNYLNILNDEYLSMIGSLSALFNALGRIFWGMFFDWSGHSFRITQGLMSLSITLFIFTWPLCSYSPYVMFPLWNFCIWFNVNCCFAIYPCVISNSFGAKFVGSILGCLTVAETFSAFFVVAVATRIDLWFHGWTNYLVMVGVAGISSILLSIAYNPKIDRKRFLWNLKMKPKAGEKKRLMGDIVDLNLSVHNYSTFTDGNSVTSGNLKL